VVTEVSSLHELSEVIIFVFKLFSRIWSTSSKKTLRRENVSFLQKTPSQRKQTFFSCFTGVEGWELKVFLPSGRGWAGSKLWFFC